MVMVLGTYNMYQSQIRQVGRLEYGLDYEDNSLGSGSFILNQKGALSIEETVSLAWLHIRRNTDLLYIKRYCRPYASSLAKVAANLTLHAALHQ